MRFVAVLVAALGAAACRPTSLGYLSPPAASDPSPHLGQLGTKIAGALRTSYRGQIERTQAPASLVPTDGSKLELRALAATVAIDGPLAHTELHFTFHNAEPRVREGRFAIALPASAAVARFAMKVDGAWREARVVPRDKARRVYEGYLHRGADPALLERDQGNQFSARVFPIAAGADKEIVLAYEHRVGETEPYTLALRGLPKVPRLTVAVTRDGVASTIDRSGETPDDVVIDVGGGPGAIAGDEAFAARIPASVAPEPEPLDRVLVLVDTSASRATVMGRQADFVRRLLGTLPSTAHVTLAAFDHDTNVLYTGAALGSGAAVDALLEHGALGASDLGGALRCAATSGATRVILVGDGAPTTGEWDPAKLAAIVATSRIERVDAVQIGQTIDRETLGVLVHAGTRPGAILDGRDPARVARQLAMAMPAEEQIHVDGAIATWPATTRGIAPGEPIWVFGLHPGAGKGTLTVRIGDRTLPVVAKVAAEPKRVRRAVAAAELAELSAVLGSARTADERTTIEERIERVALANNLVSTRTSLLVLDSDADEHPALDAPAKPVPPISVSFSGATTLENRYFVDGVATVIGTRVLTAVPGRRTGDRMASNPAQHADLARAVQGDAFSLGVPTTGAGERHDYAAPYAGTLHAVMAAIADGDRARALEAASAYQLANPADLAALVALGESLEARGAAKLAARVYGSIVDLYPTRAELLRAAGERLDRIAGRFAGARGLAIDAYRRAIRERPDQPSTYRLLAYSLVRAGRADEALDLLDEGARHATRQSVLQVIAEDAAIVAAHIVAADPGKRAAIEKRIRGPLPTAPTLRVVLSWETDANDVDLHVYDRRGNHAYYQAPELLSGGRLREDLTDGYGPELFAVDNPAAFPYKVGAHYYRRGPMGIGLGTVQVVRHDGKGGITVDDRPFVIQNDDAMVDLGIIRP